MTKVENFDAKLLEILRGNSRISNSEIARSLGVSEGAVRQRISRLVSEGAIRGFTIVEEEKAGGVNALTFVSVASGASTAIVAQRIKKVECVVKVIELTGKFDLCVFVSGDSTSEVNAAVDAVRRVPQVRATDTKIVLKEW